MNSPLEFGFDFDAPDPRRLARRDAKDTEIAAAARVQQRMNETRQAVLDGVIELGGAATAEQTENLPRFASFGHSTVRKRLGELVEMGYLIEDGTRVNSRGLPMTLYRVKTNPEAGESPATTDPATGVLSRGVAVARTGVEPVASRRDAAPVGQQSTPTPDESHRHIGYQVGDRVRVRATGRLVEVYDVERPHEPAFAQRVRCGYSIVKEGRWLAGVDQWFDGDELERVGT
jgi:hypothetical protein